LSEILAPSGLSLGPGEVG